MSMKSEINVARQALLSSAYQYKKTGIYYVSFCLPPHFLKGFFHMLSYRCAKWTNEWLWTNVFSLCWVLTHGELCSGTPVLSAWPKQPPLDYRLVMIILLPRLSIFSNAWCHPTCICIMAFHSLAVRWDYHHGYPNLFSIDFIVVFF